MDASNQIQRRRLAELRLNATAPRAHVAASRVAAVATNSLPGLLAGLVWPLMLARCMDAPTLVAALAAGLVAGGVLGVVSTEESRLHGHARPVGLAIAAAALAATLALPSARTGFFALVNAVVTSLDVAFGAYVGLIPGVGTGASSPLFGVCLGLLSAVAGWAASRLKTGAVTLLGACVVTGLSLRLGLSGSVAAFIGCGLAIGAWVAHCRVAQLPGPMRSASAVVANFVGVAALISVVFLAVGYLYKPQASVDAAHAALTGGIEEARHGHDTLPQGDLGQAGSMNDEKDGSGLGVKASAPVSSDVLLRGFVGAELEDGRWSPLAFDAYEGDWKGVMGWLGRQGLVTSRQRAAYDAQAAQEGVSAAEPTVNLRIDASRANRSYVYAPYSASSLDGASPRTDLDGSLAAGLAGPSSYSVAMDDVPTADVLASTSWLNGSDTPYAQAETVWAAFARAHYLDLGDEERAAVKEYFFAPGTWDDLQEASAATVISRVRAMLEATASYDEDPAAPPAGGSFVRWFMGEERAGNSAYFATAAVLAFRSQGIPARYVEGYRADADELNAATSQGDELRLDAESAHAWVEVYLGGIGWTPVEVTPGFYTQSVAASDVIDVSEAWSSGKSGNVYDAGSVAGELDDQEEDVDRMGGVSVTAVLRVAATACGFVLLVWLFFIAARHARLRVRRERIQSDDQDVCVPALYRYFASVMDEAGIGFDHTRPMECAGDVPHAFSGVDGREYERAVRIHQARAFGGRDLAPNELRTLRRFTERLHLALPEPKNLLDGLRRRYLKAL